MHRKTTYSRLFLPAAFLAGVVLAAGGAAAQESCAACHAELLAAGNVHAAAESCETCHQPVSTPHPQPGKATFALTRQPPGLCADCHETFGAKSHVHSPVADGSCTTCHDPHSADNPHLLAAPPAELCQTCHTEEVGFPHLHGPVANGDCGACHAPHESDVQALLRQPGDELCFGCHSDLRQMLGKKYVHAAVESGCTSCHDPHGAAQPKLLGERGAALCFQCHGDVGEQVAKARVAHAPLAGEDGCVACHSPHATDHRKLLTRPEKETCLGCHPAVITRAMTVLHGPINDGACTACHEPHGGERPQLLTGSFPAGEYAPYNDAEFGLCFDCHNRDLLQYPDTSFATNFRDGEKNLHFLHVNDEQKGRSCVLCHAVHGADNPTLIATSVPFGQWQLPLKFVKTATGGGCAPGCHKPYAYDREVPGRKPEVPKPSVKSPP